MSTLFISHDFPRGVARFNNKIPPLPPTVKNFFLQNFLAIFACSDNSLFGISISILFYLIYCAINLLALPLIYVVAVAGL